MEQPAAPESQLRFLRHNVRGRLNALKLCVSALEILGSRQEVLDFLEMIEQAADGTVTALDELEAHPDWAEPPHGQP